VETILALIPPYQEGPRIATFVEGVTACLPVVGFEGRRRLPSGQPSDFAE